MGWVGETFASHVSESGLFSSTHKELSQQKDKQPSFRKWAKDLKVHLFPPRQMYTWPRDT